MQPEEASRLKRWLWFAYIMLALMALFSSLGGFFVRIFLIGFLFAAWQLLRIGFGKIRDKMSGQRGSSQGQSQRRPKTDYTTRPGSTGYRRPEADSTPATEQEADFSEARDRFVGWFKRIPLPVKIVGAIWTAIAAFVVMVIYIVSTSGPDPAEAEYLRQVAEGYYNREVYDTAYTYYREAMNIDPSSDEVMLGYGNIMYVRNQADSALYYYDQILERNPDHFYARYNKGWVYTAQNRWDESNKVLSELLEKNPDSWQVKELMGDNYYSLGNTSEARRLYLEAWPSDEYNQALNERLGILVQGSEGDIYRERAAATNQ